MAPSASTGANIRVDTVSLDSGSVSLDAAARFDVTDVGTAPAAGLFVGLPGGTGNVSISGGAALNTVDTTIADGGSVVILNGSLSSTGGIELQGGQLSGSGVVVADINNTGGTVAPGHSPGVLSQTGDFTHSLGGTLAIEIGGTTLGTEYDQLAITGSASLSGMLDVALLDLGGGPFAPTLGNLFTILTATGGVTGTFATMAGDLPALTGGNEWAINYNATDVVLEIVVAGLDGDYNGDSMVDAADYTVWRDNLGAPDETALNGNGDGLNGVDAADYSLWATSFGSTLASSAGVAGSIGVPEPTAAWMMLIGWMMLARRRTLLAEWTRPY